MTSVQTSQIGRAAAYYYSQRKKEKKFYILCQDYLFGHAMANGFKKGLKQYYPEAEIVGEDYHKLFLTDFAPYLTKIKASGAEVVYTGDWIPDAANLLKQAGLTSSTSEAMRMIKQGAVKINGERVEDRALLCMGGSTDIYQVGKRRFARVTLS